MVVLSCESRGHVAVAEGNADAEAACGFGGDDVVAGVADHDHIGGVDAQDFGGVLQRQRAGFLFGQAVATENQAEVVGEVRVVSKVRRRGFRFVGDDHQRDAQRFEQCQSGFGFGVGTGEVAQVVAVVFHVEHETFFPINRARLLGRGRW